MTGNSNRPDLFVVGAPPPSEVSDEALMSLVRSGERRALEALARRHLTAVTSFCARCVGDPHAAEELAQETFLELWQRRSRYQERARFGEYLYTLAVNRCRNRRRWWQRWLRRRDAFGEARASAAPSPLEQLVENESHERLWKAVGRLPAGLREAVLLRFGQGLDYAAIGHAIGTSEVGARSRVFRALERLRDEVCP